MVKEQRYEKILKIVEEKDYVSVHELAKILYVSLPTIRRDLSELHRRELLMHCHGGAKKLNTENSVLPIKLRKSQNKKVKRLLCKKCLSLIKENSVIFVDSSTTTAQICDLLQPNYSILVVTNSIILSLMLTKKGIQNFCTGGILQQNSMCYAGEYAEEFIRKFNFDLAIFSSYGVNERGNIVDTSIAETSLRKTVINQSNKKVFLCDDSKFFLDASFNLTNLSSLDYIITNYEKVNDVLPKNYNGKVFVIKN